MTQNATCQAEDIRWFRRMLLIAVTVLVIAGLSLFRVKTLPAAAPAAVPAGYTACIVDNHIAIYRNGETTPVQLTDIDVRSLPLTDQQSLHAGILLPDDEALARLLEDYGS